MFMVYGPGFEGAMGIANIGGSGSLGRSGSNPARIAEGSMHYEQVKLSRRQFPQFAAQLRAEEQVSGHFAAAKPPAAKIGNG